MEYGFEGGEMKKCLYLKDTEQLTFEIDKNNNRVLCVTLKKENLYMKFSFLLFIII
jgi:hypothetical protein